MPSTCSKQERIAEFVDVDNVDLPAIDTLGGEHAGPGVLTVKLVGGGSRKHNERDGNMISGEFDDGRMKTESGFCRSAIVGPLVGRVKKYARNQ